MHEWLVREVWHRAGNACEYCRISQAFYPAPFEIDHIISRQHGGLTRLNNLALSCLYCNSHKGPNIAGLDPMTRKLTRLFNPRRQKWQRHFRREGAYLVGMTSVGRVTIAVLAVNDTYPVLLRSALIKEGLSPVNE